MLLVVANHLVLAAPLPWGRVQRLLYTGWVGVDLFFVLSGFLITGILLDAKGGPHYFRNFYARRVLRIFPLYYGVLVVAILTLTVLTPHAPMLRLQGWLWAYATNIKIAASGWVFIAGRLQFHHLWTLAVEEQFYLVWPAVVLLLSRRSLLWVCAVVFVLSPALRIVLCLKGHSIAAYVSTPCQLDALTVGVALAILVRSQAGRRLLDKLLVPAALLCLVPLAFMFRYGGLDHNLMNRYTVSLGSTLLAATFCWAIWSAVSGGRVRFLDFAPLTWIGGISYGIYVLHPFCLEVAPRNLFARSPMLSLIAFDVIGLGLSIGAATLSWHLFEKHFLRLKRAFPRTKRAGNEAVPCAADTSVSASENRRAQRRLPQSTFQFNTIP